MKLPNIINKKPKPKICERCKKEIHNHPFTLRLVEDSGSTIKRKVCIDCKYDINRFVKNYYHLETKHAPPAPIRYDIISINGERFIRQDLICDLGKSKNVQSNDQENAG